MGYYLAATGFPPAGAAAGDGDRWTRGRDGELGCRDRGGGSDISVLKTPQLGTGGLGEI